MVDAFRVIRRPRVTEKSHRLTERFSTYVFEVERRATKDQIKKAVEDLYAAKGVHVVKVRTLVQPGKARRYRMIRGRTSPVKKAFVTLRKGETIDVV